ncbi:branched-chain amino acid ABC transporter substrate-binding protein [Streptomyces sp. H27-D2]|uniref:branched-chain amino acid ABC transporter substrate-binding protein n=1 Tax=Streptomyces sp. H27-D2 TaxID=3046304 RepID=UPI002DB8BB8E|nr:branched-chain amino acid ABC transporter substrate-binding protein [Streptomyces sp. H27-D2]MEC4019731.1 branched-chain amino acid ABC transporter substrate-binding protein [Streptomyces sp. H27-D2]
MLVLTSVLTTGALTLTACGSRDDKGGGDGDGGSKTTVVIGVDAPLTGDLSALGQGIKNSVDLAAKTANKNKEVPGVTFKVEALDDQAQPSSGGQNANKFVGNQDVLGVVGPLNSSVAQSMQKVFDDAGLTQVSPANTTPDLSQGKDWKKDVRKRQFDTYFRTATTVEIQGAFAGKYAHDKLKAKTVYVIDDQKTYGVGLAASFKDKFTSLGGKVVGSEHVNPEDRDFNAIVSKVRSAKPDFVYYGGEYPAAAPLSQQVKNGGVDVPFMGGDGMYSAEYITQNKKAAGDIATSVGKPVEQLASAKSFIADYKAAGYKDAYEAYGGSSYDSAWSIIQAVKAAVADNDDKLPAEPRAKVLAAMSKVKFDGVTGAVSFDKYGDTTNTMITAYKVEGKAWKPNLSEQYKD